MRRLVRVPARWLRSCLPSGPRPLFRWSEVHQAEGCWS